MNRRRGNRWIVTGLLLILAALFLTFYNIREDLTAGKRAEELVGQIEVRKPERKQESEAPQKLYEQYPDLPMPVVTIDGKEYIGTLEIPALELTLPVMSDWSYPDLKISPCRYMGSAYSRDLIIAGHNYRKHFGRLKALSIGDEVAFTDAEGNLFAYLVADIEELPGTAVEEMEAGAWDLTLFTCTYGGKTCHDPLHDEKIKRVLDFSSTLLYNFYRKVSELFSDCPQLKMVKE